MKFKSATACIVAAAIASAPLSAFAHGHYGGWHGFGLFAAGAAVVGITAAVISAPFVALGSVASAPYYAPPPAYYQQPANYYAQAPAYPPQSYYSQAPAYYSQPAPAYYPPQTPYYAAPQYYPYR